MGGKEQIRQQGALLVGEKPLQVSFLGCQVFVSGLQGEEEAGQLVLAPVLIHLPVREVSAPSLSVLIVNWSLNLET